MLPGGSPRDLREVLHVDVLGDDDDGLGEHHEPEAPERVHHLARLARIALLDRDDDEVVEHALGRHVHVHDLGQEEANDGQEDALGGLAEPVVFLGGPPHDGGRIDRALAARDGLQVKDRVVARQRVVARVIAEGPFETALRGIDPALEHDLRLRRHLEIHRLARHHRHARPAQPAREHHLVDAGRQGRRARVDRARVAAEGDGHLHGLLLLFGDAMMLGGALVDLPVHAERLVVEHLKTVHADIARPRDRDRA